MKQEYWLNPLNKTGLLEALMSFLAGDAQISFEGDLSGCDFSGIEKEISTESGELKRVYNDGNSDYMIFRLDKETIQPILEQVLPEDRLINKIIHIQIQKNGQLQLLIGDYFHDECISVGTLFTVKQLETLKENGLIKSNKTSAETKTKYPWLKA
jgi:hypothetical protein